MIARYYDASKNPEGAHIPGVPLADIDDATFDALPEHLRNSVDASPFYRKTKPSSESAPLKAASAEKAKE